MFTSFGRGYLKTKQMLFYSFVYKIFTTLPNVQVSKCIVLILFLTILCFYSAFNKKTYFTSIKNGQDKIKDWDSPKDDDFKLIIL